MATKKAKKKTKTLAKKIRSLKKTQKKSARKKASTGKKKIAAKRAAKPVVQKAAKRSASRAAKPARKIARASQKRIPPQKQTIDQAYLGSRKATSTSADADSQGLSEVESADSESVGELLDEGNALEAGVVSGVEEADNHDEREVRTREVPEDDVPEEYLDQD